jgi:catechol 2,3-dioxygenase-like lactoylglutathione lyase family enzyme
MLIAYARFHSPERRAPAIPKRAGGQTTLINQRTTLRVARPTDNLDEVVRFYTVGLGLKQLGSFEDHDGFDGVMVGTPGAQYHLEFTHKRGHDPGRAPTRDNLLVFYVPDEREWQGAIERMVAAGYGPVPAFNPYWQRNGRTFEDPDGYRVVLQHGTWSQ